MKKLLSSMFVATLAIFTIASAQAPSDRIQTPQERQQHQKRWAAELSILDKLNLTPTQKDQIKTSLKSFRKSMQDLHKQGATTDPAVFKLKHQALKKAYIEKLRATLTPAQLIQYRAIHRDMRAKAEAAKAVASTAKP